jgi:hypothetical protein
MQERGSLGLNPRAFGLFIIVVKELYLVAVKALIKLEPKLQILCNQSPV